MAFISCPYLDARVELSEERERHIGSHHPDLLPAHRERIIETVGDPDQVRRSNRVGNAKLFSKWFPNLRGGRYVVVVVILDPGPDARPWIITAYLTRRLRQGDIEWQRN